MTGRKQHKVDNSRKVIRHKLVNIGKFDNNGFLRIKMRVGRVGAFKYDLNEYPQEIRETPALAGKTEVFSFRPPTTLFDALSMKTLEGIPIVATGSHPWLIPDLADRSGASSLDDTNRFLVNSPRDVSVGQIAGSPYRDGDFLIAEGVITDAAVAAMVQDGQLTEISSAYTCSESVESGEWHGQTYDLIQLPPMTYNHILLLPDNEAREGPDIKILNKKGKGIMSDGKNKDTLIAVQTPDGQTIQVAEKDIGTIQRVFNKLDDLEKKMLEKKASAKANQEGSFEQAIARATELSDQIKALEAEKADQMKVIGELRAQIDALMSPEAQEEVVAEMQDTETVAEALDLNACGYETEEERRRRGSQVSNKAWWEDLYKPSEKEPQRPTINMRKRLLIGYYLNQAGHKALKPTDMDDSYVRGVWDFMKVNLKPKSASSPEPKFNSAASVLGHIKRNSKPLELTRAQRLGYEPIKNAKERK